MSSLFDAQNEFYEKTEIDVSKPHVVFVSGARQGVKFERIFNSGVDAYKEYINLLGQGFDVTYKVEYNINVNEWTKKYWGLL